MTENDRDLLTRFKVAKFAYDKADLLERVEIAKHVGISLGHLQYLDDLELRAIADIARLEFGNESDWPPMNEIQEMITCAEQKLVAAIQEAECF